MSTTKAPEIPSKKPRHSLSSIDKEFLTAICALCGPTDVHQIKVKKYTAYICATASRERSRAYRLAHPRVSRPQQFKPTGHVLTNVDDTNRTATCSQCGPVKIYIRRNKNILTRVCKNAANTRSKRAEAKRQRDNLEFIQNYKLSHGCKNCGDHENSEQLQFHAPGKNRRFDHINKLLRLKRERMIVELEKYDVLCKNCHDQVHYKPPRVTTRKRIKRNPPAFMYDA